MHSFIQKSIFPHILKKETFTKARLSLEVYLPDRWLNF